MLVLVVSCALAGCGKKEQPVNPTVENQKHATQYRATYGQPHAAPGTAPAALGTPAPAGR